MKNYSDFIKKIFIFSSFVLFVLNPLSAKKKSKKLDIEPVEVEPVASAIEASADTNSTQLKLPSAKRTFFSKIDQNVISMVENGSPDELRNAMAKIRKNESDYSDTEKVLIAVATEIMKQAWPSEKISWDSFEAGSDNPYMGAIQSAKSGIFDLSTGNTDFLSTILPAFVIFNSGYKTADFDNCKNALLNALKLNADSVLANYMLGLLYEKNSQFSDAGNYLKKAYEKSTPSQELTLAYVRVLQKTGEVSKASSIMNTIKEDSAASNNIEVLKQNAYVAFANKDYSKAEQYVARVLQQTPNDLEFVLFRTKILIEKNDYIHAVSLLDMYARYNDSSLDYLLLRAKVQLDWSKNTGAATETVEKALQLYPENLEALMIAAKISSITDSPVAGKYADELSQKVLKKDPSNNSALFYALNGLTQRENWQEAYDISKQLSVTEPVNAEIVQKHVEICIKLGKKSEAFDYAAKMHNANPNDETILQAYILAYSQNGNRDSVVKYIDSLMPGASAKMKSYLYYRRSFLQYSEDTVLADLRSSLISNPRNSDALFRLYEIYYDKKDYRKAQYYLRQVVAINPNDTSVKKLNEALTKLIQ